MDVILDWRSRSPSTCLIGDYNGTDIYNHDGVPAGIFPRCNIRQGECNVLASENTVGVLSENIIISWNSEHISDFRYNYDRA